MEEVILLHWGCRNGLDQNSFIPQTCIVSLAVSVKVFFITLIYRFKNGTYGNITFGIKMISYFKPKKGQLWLVVLFV